MSRDNLIVPILNVSEPNATNEDVEKPKATQISLAKKPPAASTGITSFLDLPEGVGPVVEDVNSEITFPDVDDSAALDVDDEFSYSGEASFGTLKPTREGSTPPKEEILAEESSGTDDALLNNTIISNPNAGEQSADMESEA